MDNSSGTTTRDKLIETAKELFLTKGVDRVGVREIATKAGINLSLMNYYFRSKEKLFETIFENIINDKAVILRHILDSDLPIDEKHIKDIKKIMINYRDNNRIIRTKSAVAHTHKVIWYIGWIEY